MVSQLNTSQAQNEFAAGIIPCQNQIIFAKRVQHLIFHDITSKPQIPSQHKMTCQPRRLLAKRAGHGLTVECIAAVCIHVQPGKDAKTKFARHAIWPHLWQTWTESTSNSVPKGDARSKELWTKHDKTSQ